METTCPKKKKKKKRRKYVPFFFFRSLPLSRVQKKKKYCFNRVFLLRVTFFFWFYLPFRFSRLFFFLVGGEVFFLSST